MPSFHTTKDLSSMNDTLLRIHVGTGGERGHPREQR